MSKVLHCPCSLEKYCDKVYAEAFHNYIHSKKGLSYLLTHYDGKTEIVSAIHDAFLQLK